MQQQKPPQMLKHRKSIVTKANSLISLLSKDAYANVGLLDHVDIICSITDSENLSSLYVLLQESNHHCFLVRGGSEKDERRVRLRNDSDKELLCFLIFDDSLQLSSSEHETEMAGCVLIYFCKLFKQISLIFFDFEDREILPLKHS